MTNPFSKTVPDKFVFNESVQAHFQGPDTVKGDSLQRSPQGRDTVERDSIQRGTTRPDTALQQKIIRDSIVPDTSTLVDVASMATNADSLALDTPGVNPSGSSLTANVNILSRDSMWLDRESNILYLYREAKVKYQDFELAADFIKVDNHNKRIFASGLIDHTGKYVGRPVMSMGGETPKAVDSLIYNFETEEGITFGIFSEVDGGYIQANRVKKNRYNEMSIYHGIYSTCNLPEPHTHFGFFIDKGIVTQNQIVSGPAHLVVEGVHFRPLMIPFGFFPKPDKKASGFLFPSFGEDGVRGFHMRDLGWYFAFNDYWDSEFRGTIYTKGSYEVSNRTSYRVNYKYEGGFNLRYAAIRNGVEGTEGYKPTQDFNITWQHTQRPEANPGSTFSASVNFGTGSYYQNTAAGGSYNYEQLTQNEMSSSISYGRRFMDGKVNFSSSLSHRQDITSGNVSLELPAFSLNVTTFNPFDSKDRIGDQKWYQKITMGYSFQGRNSIQTTEDKLFKKESLGQFQNGFQHTVPVSLSLNMLRYIQFNTSVNYTERWYLQSMERRLENTPGGFREVRDTISGFKRAYDYSVSSGFSTTVYGQYPRFGNVQAMRHTMKPSFSLNYRPDFASDLFGFYRTFIGLDGREQLYSIFQSGIFGSPSSGKSMSIGFSLDNTLEAKVGSSDESATNGLKKIKLIQGLSINGNYNFAADSLNLSTISFSGRTTLFNDKVSLNFNGAFDPYQLNATGVRINRFALQDGKLARLTNFGLSMDYSINSEAVRNRTKQMDNLDEGRASMTPEQQDMLARISSDPNAFVDFNIPWNLAGSFSFQYSKGGMVRQITSTVNVHGDFNITDKWKVQFNTGYDFKNKQIPMTRFSIYRDLHCWDMSFGWVPFGQYQSYNVTIRAKASILQDLKLTKRNDYYGR